MRSSEPDIYLSRSGGFETQSKDQYYTNTIIEEAGLNEDWTVTKRSVQRNLTRETH